MTYHHRQLWWPNSLKQTRDSRCLSCHSNDSARFRWAQVFVTINLKFIGFNVIEHVQTENIFVLTNHYDFTNISVKILLRLVAPLSGNHFKKTGDVKVSSWSIIDPAFWRIWHQLASQANGMGVINMKLMIAIYLVWRPLLTLWSAIIRATWRRSCYVTFCQVMALSKFSLTFCQCHPQDFILMHYR